MVADRGIAHQGYVSAKARHATRDPVAVSRMTHSATEAVVRITSDKADGPTAGTHTFDGPEAPGDLLARVSRLGEVYVRYCGADKAAERFLRPRSVALLGRRRQDARALTSLPAPLTTPGARASRGPHPQGGEWDAARRHPETRQVLRAGLTSDPAGEFGRLRGRGRIRSRLGLRRESLMSVHSSGSNGSCDRNRVICSPTRLRGACG